MARRHFGIIDKRPNGLYRARFIHPYKKYTEKGTPNRISLGTFIRKTDAQNALDRVHTQIMTGEWKDEETLRAEQAEAEAKAKTEAITLAEYAKTWLERYEGRHGTWRDYDKQMRLRILPRFGDYRLKDITRREVREWLESDAMETANLQKRTRATLSTCLRYAVDDDLIEFNPVPSQKRLALPKGVKATRRKERPALTFPEIEQLAQAVTAPQSALFTRLMGATGMRPSEIRGLQGRHIGTTKEGYTSIVIERSISGAGINTTYKEDGGKTLAGTRTLICPPHLADNLQALADRAGLDGYLFYAQTNMKKPCKPHSTPISDRTVKGNVRRACERLREENPDFPIITPYDLRHSFETNVQNSEGQRLAEQYVLNAYMGHADATMGDYYARVRNGDFERLAEAVSRATFPETLGDNVTSIDKLLRA